MKNLHQECISLQELPILDTLHFRLNSERLFAHIASHDIWMKTGVEFITDIRPKTSREATPRVNLITDRVGEERLGMVMVFCHHDQNKMASDALSVLCQWESPDPSEVMVRGYTNTPYIPQGTS